MRALAAARRYPLILCLLLQASLLLPRLDLLPIWGDEFHTLETIAKPIHRSLDDLTREYHPPAYYLLARAWNALPLPGTDIARLRALSVLMLLVATVLLWKFWGSQLASPARWWVLALWVSSPFLLLYARMARSYMLQMVLAMLTIRCATALIAEPARRRHWITCAASLAALFYVHYLPAMGLALALGGVLVYLAIRRTQPRYAVALAAVASLAVLLYLPWILHLAETINMVANDKPYLASGAHVREHVLRLAYTAVSFAYGETLSAVALGAAVLLAPLVGWFAWRGARTLPPWLPLIAIAAGCAYYGAMNTVAFSFIPARLAFVYPFFVLLLVIGFEQMRKAGSVALSALLLLAPVAWWNYHAAANFLNKGYVIPYRVIAESILSGSDPARTLVLLDCHGLDPYVFAGRLKGHARLMLLRDAKAIQRAQTALANSKVDRVWLIRAGHDASPTHINDTAERELSRTLETRPHLFVPYSSLDRLAMSVFNWTTRPTHVVAAIEMVRR